ncbi:hypothetical protein RBB50_009399 [Rhinocladiella similis]
MGTPVDRNRLENNLPAIQRFITDHNAEGKAVFSARQPEKLSWQGIDDSASFALGYTTSQTPVDLEDGKDITVYEGFLEKRPGIVVPGGTVLRFVDLAPGATSPMHRTVSLDYGVVLEGEIELLLDSGEVRRMRRGDVAIQRGTMHAWRNPSDKSYARMMYVLQESMPLTVAGQVLKEDYGRGMPGVPPSSA